MTVSGLEPINSLEGRREESLLQSDRSIPSLGDLNHQPGLEVRPGIGDPCPDLLRERDCAVIEDADRKGNNLVENVDVGLQVLVSLGPRERDRMSVRFQT